MTAGRLAEALGEHEPIEAYSGTPEQQRLTREQWRALETREGCHWRSHAPHHHVGTCADPIGTWTCECGDVTWTPTTRETT